MNPHMTPAGISGFLERTLLRVQKPARYTGGEWNAVVKDWDQTPQRVALAFPDIYDLGMSNLGLAILYDLINKRPDMLAERVYAPWTDMEKELRTAGVPLFSLESRHPLADFDVIGFSLPYEQLYTNVLNMLDLAGLPLRADQRSAEHPLIIAGGSGCYNPEPMSAFFDAMVIGEGEEVVFEVVEVYAEWQRERREREQRSRGAEEQRVRARARDHWSLTTDHCLLITGHRLPNIPASHSGSGWRRSAASTCRTCTRSVTTATARWRRSSRSTMPRRRRSSSASCPPCPNRRRTSSCPSWIRYTTAPPSRSSAAARGAAASARPA
ncbi:MAG: hypothetical protein R2844_20920 [Caldilineales bacterium]